MITCMAVVCRYGVQAVNIRVHHIWFLCQVSENNFLIMLNCFHISIHVRTLPNFSFPVKCWSNKCMFEEPDTIHCPEKRQKCKATWNKRLKYKRFRFQNIYSSQYQHTHNKKNHINYMHFVKHMCLDIDEPKKYLRQSCTLSSSLTRPRSMPADHRLRGFKL